MLVFADEKFFVVVPNCIDFQDPYQKLEVETKDINARLQNNKQNEASMLISPSFNFFSSIVLVLRSLRVAIAIERVKIK